jgi:septum formation protein
MILASKSPRRQEIMQISGFDFNVVIPDVDETFTENLPVQKIAESLAERKAAFVLNNYPDELIIAADTLVVLKGEIIGKPINLADAKRMLSELSGNIHMVVSGVSVMTKSKKHSFNDVSRVHFNKLADSEIDYYIQNYNPLDKAGAYGVQDWIGMVAIKKVEGSFYNVMGLPIHKLYQVLRDKFNIQFS